PVHGGDDRLAAGLEAAQHRLATLRPRLAVERALLREIRDVGPRDEGFGAGAREDGTPDRRLRRHALRGVGQLVHHLVVQRVELVGPVDGDARDGVADLEEEGVVGHGKEWYNENAERGTRNAEQTGRPPSTCSAFRVPTSARPAPATARTGSPTRSSPRW